MHSLRYSAHLQVIISFVVLQVLKLGFTVGIIPSLNIAAGLIGFTGIKAVVAAAQALPGFRNIRGLSKPFTRYIYNTF